MYAAILHIEYEHFFSEDYSDIVMAERETLKSSNQAVLLFIKQLVSSLNTKCLHLSTTYCIIVTLVSMHSLHSYAVKNNLTVTDFHTYRLYIFTYRYITHAKCELFPWRH